jgi:radical SAM-linked protein
LERVLFRFTKGEPVRFVGHLDLMRVVERAMRRSGFPIMYSQGFNPRPRMSFASALTLGATSDWELCQLDLAEDLSESRLRSAFEDLRRQLPPGVEIHEVWPIPLERRNPYIQVRAAEYALTLLGEGVAERTRQFLQEGPGIPRALESAVEESPGQVVLNIKLPVGERDGVRIRDLVAELEQGVPLRVERLHRTRLWCELDPAMTDEADSGENSEAAAGEAEGTRADTGAHELPAEPLAAAGPREA